MRKLGYALLVGCLMASITTAASTPLLVVEQAPLHGLVMTRVDLTWVLKDAAYTAPAPPVLQAHLLPDRTPIPLQFVPDADYDTAVHATGRLVLNVPKEGESNIELVVEKETPTPAPVVLEGGEVSTSHFSLEFSPSGTGGLPSSITFKKTGKRFDTFTLNDRVYCLDIGGYSLRYDVEAKPLLVSSGPLCTVVRVHGRYCQPGGKCPPSKPEATYDWYVFNEKPLVFVEADVRQTEVYAWHELHLLELNYPDESFKAWASGKPLAEGRFSVTKKSTTFNDWGALIEGRDVIGMFGTGGRIYDGRGEYGTYLHGTWREWESLETRMSAWLYIDSLDEPAKAVEAAAQTYGQQGRTVLTRRNLHEAIRNASEEVFRNSRWWAALARSEEFKGNLDVAEQLAYGKMPANWWPAYAGDLALALAQGEDGISVRSVSDLGAERELLSRSLSALFSIVLRDVTNRENAFLLADAGWKRAEIKHDKDGLALEWADPADPRLTGISVRVNMSPDADNNAWRWTLTVNNKSANWSISNVAFPQLTLADLGERSEVLFPRGPGEVKKNAWRDSFSFRSLYPCGWGAMQFLAAYNGETGLYFGMHDPMGSTKNIIVQTDPGLRQMELSYDHPAEDMGGAGNDFKLNGEAVWQLMRGDWFDAATIYKAWARKKARWWPKIGKEGREDTPLWMRELCAWAQTGGAPGECVKDVKKMQEYLGVPIGFHWYNWHQIPFDNDYPHYFPTKEGFAEAVRNLQANNVYVMPYINGRLWDTRDKGIEDFEFSSLARAAVTKDETGKPYTETYHSKETDGSKVVLGVMCPATKLWQDKVKAIVLRLQNEEDVKGVYIDQIAAASPKLCMDKSHGHPLGGGAWWNKGYWKMLDGIRNEMQSDRMITTECNAEPFAHKIDAFLTWHWQHDGQVPAFPAIYGGVCQMFGRSYGGGVETSDRAMRMKAAQQLVYGEQIGWINPKMVLESESGPFFRDAVQMRYKLRRYFYAGEMARPPKMEAEMPEVKADWQWHGEWWVTTNAVLTGAWRLPDVNETVLIFVNVSDYAVPVKIRLDLKDYGFESAEARVWSVGSTWKKNWTDFVSETMTFGARSVNAWILGE